MTKHHLTHWIATSGLAFAVSLSVGTVQAQPATPAALAAPASQMKGGVVLIGVRL